MASNQFKEALTKKISANKKDDSVPGLTEKKREMSIIDLIKKQQPAFKMALGKAMEPERFTRIAMTIVRQSPELMISTPASLLGALMQSAQLGLEPNTLGKSYIIPRRNKGVWEANFQIGYKGLLELFYNSSQAQSVMTEAVYENDDFEYELGLEPKLKHIPALSDRGDIIFYYAVARMKNGAYAFKVMSVDDIKAHAVKHSKAYASNNSPWVNHFDAMAKKTVLIQVLKTLPLSTRLNNQIEQDNTIKHYDKNLNSMEEAVDVTDFSSVEISEGADELSGTDENEIHASVSRAVNQEMFNPETGEFFTGYTQ